jgi:hypothetical protein
LTAEIALDPLENRQKLTWSRLALELDDSVGEPGLIGDPDRLRFVEA